MLRLSPNARLTLVCRVASTPTSWSIQSRASRCPSSRSTHLITAPTANNDFLRRCHVYVSLRTIHAHSMENKRIESEARRCWSEIGIASVPSTGVRNNRYSARQTLDEWCAAGVPAANTMHANRKGVCLFDMVTSNYLARLKRSCSARISRRSPEGAVGASNPCCKWLFNVTALRLRADCRPDADRRRCLRQD